MNQRPSSIVDEFLEQLVTGGNFDDIPMTPDITFRSPLSETNNADNYRLICSKLAERVVGLSMRTRASAGDTTHLTYDLDLGLANGPIPTAHIITFDNDAMSNVEVIFDAMLLTGPHQ